MKKSFLSQILILIIILLSFFFIYNKKDIKNEKEIVFWTLQLSTFDKYINNIIANFETENPEYKIKWIDIPYSEGKACPGRGYGPFRQDFHLYGRF